MELALEVKFISTFAGDERRPMEVTSNAYFRGVGSTNQPTQRSR